MRKEQKHFKFAKCDKCCEDFFLKQEMFLFNIGGTEIQMTEFLLQISVPFSLLEKDSFGSKRIFLSCFFVYLHPLSLCARLVSTRLSGTWALIQQILEHTCNIPAGVRLSMCLDDFGSGS